MASIPGMRSRGGSGSQLKARLIMAAVIAIFAIVTYYSQKEKNPITGEDQHLSLSTQQEIALGLQAVPEMAAQHGGEHPDRRAQAHVDKIGQRLLAALNQKLASQNIANPWEFQFHLLRDDKTVNAFALPGGQVFITGALYEQLETEGQLAGVLGHEIGHVIERHGAERMASDGLLQGLAGAAGVAGGDAQSAQMARMVGQMVSMSYGRGAELESDKWGVRLMADAGYDPRAMIGVMKVLEKASGSGGPPEMMSTHPKPANRIAYIEQVIASEFPNGVPAGLEP